MCWHIYSSTMSWHSTITVRKGVPLQEKALLVLLLLIHQFIRRGREFVDRTWMFRIIVRATDTD